MLRLSGQRGASIHFIPIDATDGKGDGPGLLLGLVMAWANA
jgi:hypothetical protein